MTDPLTALRDCAGPDCSGPSRWQQGCGHDDCDEPLAPVLPHDATPAMRKFARQIAAMLDYGADDCDGAGRAS